MTMTEARLRAIPDMSELEHRLWSKVQIVDDEDSCWPWQRATSPDGYGLFQWTPPGEMKRRAVNAHRVVLYLVTGVMPVVGCHDCDNPPCCRPKHLYDGTHQTNGADKAARKRSRGRPQNGEQNAISVLTDEVVLHARKHARQGWTVTFLANLHGVKRATLNYAVNGTTWKHLDGIEPPVLQRARR